MATQGSTKVVTGAVRLSYANLFQAVSFRDGQPPKYSVVLLIPKNTRDGKETMKRLRAAEEVAKEQGKTSKWGGKIPKNFSSIIHDGDEEKDLEENPEYEGMWYMSVSANEEYPPGIVDRNLNKIMDRSEVYSGCWARVSLAAYPFSAQGNNGVSFGLRNVQKLRDDDAFGGVSRAEDDFEALGDEDDEDSGLI